MEGMKRNHKYSLLITVCSVLKWNILASAVPRLLLIGLQFCQPSLIQRTINYVSNRNDQPGNVGWGLVGAYAIVYIGLALVTASSIYLINRVVVRIRGGLISLIYQKTVDLSTTGLEQGAALTLMSTDMEIITQQFVNLNDIWAATIQVAIALSTLHEFGRWVHCAWNLLPLRPSGHGGMHHAFSSVSNDMGRRNSVKGVIYFSNARFDEEH
jgi:ATP-binding cassette subfamily C (CFTR/MRP) protein 1